MYKLRLIAMVVLSSGVIAGAAALALRSGDPVDPEKDRIDFLVRSLGDRNPDVRRKAEAELRQLGPKASEALRTAMHSSDRSISDRARKLLEEIDNRETAASKNPRSNDSAGNNDPVPPEIPSFRSVSIELLPAPDGGRYYVRLTNHDSVPYVIARENVQGRWCYGRHARFEVTDAQGRTQSFAAESHDASVSGTPDLVVVGPGETLDLFAGQDDGMTQIPEKLAPGTYSVRFVYDAASTGYRHGVQNAPSGAPLPPQEFASAAVEITILP
jgi:hypothetical protein